MTRVTAFGYVTLTILSFLDFAEIGSGTCYESFPLCMLEHVLAWGNACSSGCNS